MMDLYIIKESIFDSDLIIGREFIKKHKLTLVYSLHNAKSEGHNAHVDLIMSYLLLYVEDEEVGKLDEILREHEIDFDSEAKIKLIKTILNIDKQKAELIDDGYAVKIHLKDDSVFAFAPRRFAYVERLQLRL